METNDPEAAAEIMAVIEAETRAFWEKDFDGVAAAWVQEDWTRRSGWWARGGITWRRGWDEIGGRMRRMIDESPDPSDVAQAVRREDVFVRVVGDMAWVTFSQVAPEGDDPDMDMPGVSHETRILERRDGNWRIAYHNYLLAEGPAPVAPRGET